MRETDQDIIRILKKDSRTPYTAIAERLGVSEGTIRNRIERLIERGTIKRFTVQTNEPVRALVGVRLKAQAGSEPVVRKALSLGASRAYEVTGKYDIILSLREEKAENLNTIIEGIRKMDSVIETETFTVMKESEAEA